MGAHGRGRRRHVAAWAAALVASGAGCGYTLSGYIPPRVDACASAACTAQHFKAGAARVDITPIPGVPIGGYSVEGKVARGVWSRLQARAIYLEDEMQQPLVLVSTDLMIMPSGLPDRVAERLHDLGLTQLGREQLLLSATETHQSPGNYLTDPMHNSVGSSPRPGFDPDLFDFLARRIARAIQEAHAGRRNATVRLGNAPDKRLAGFFRNRSLRAFLLNPEAAEVMGEAGVPPCATTSEDFPDPRACLAVDPRVEVLEIVEAPDPGTLPQTDPEVIATAVFLATHTTVLGPETEVFGGDVFGATASLLERGAAPGCIGASAPPVPGVAALFNGAQGDVTLVSSARDRWQVLALAEKLAGRVCELRATTEPLATTKIALGYGTEALRGREFVDPAAPLFGNRPCQDTDAVYCRKTAERALPGYGQLGGAEDGRSQLWDLGFREGVRNFQRTEGQGMKRVPPLIGDLMDWFEPPEETVPVGVYQIGPLALVGLPGEFTTVMGRRIRARVRAELEQLAAETGTPAPVAVLPVGFANGHASYVPTPQEYDLQLYEGASAFVGAATGPFVGERLTALASGLVVPAPAGEGVAYRFQVGSPYTFRLHEFGASPYYVDDGLETLTVPLVDDPDERLARRDLPTFCWYDGIPRLDPGERVCNGGRVLPRVTVRDAATDEPVAESTLGLDLVTVVNRVGLDYAEWCAIWLVPDALAAARPDDAFVLEAERLRDVPTSWIPQGSASTPSIARSSPFTPKASLAERPAENHLQDPAANALCSPWLAWLGLCPIEACHPVAAP